MAINPDGKKNTYGYDIMNRITAVRDENGVIAEYGYDDIGQLVSDTRGELATLYDYNDLGQIEEMVTAAGDEALMSFGYTYDANGNITREERREESGTSVRAYAYDAASQLTEMREAGYSEQFTYDNAGNRLTHTVNDTKTEYTYNAANQLTVETQGAKTIEYIHNQNGDLAGKSTGEKYTYDAAGHLTSIIGNGVNQQFTYDGAGNRMSKTVDGVTTAYVNDITAAYTQVLQTYDENGAVLNTYDYGVNRIRSRGETDETYLYDALGSVVGTFNPKNELTRYRYTAYGNLLPSSPMPCVYGYNAEDTDYTTGLQYLRARYYDVNLGRFVQKDEFKGDSTLPTTLNRYTYCYNNPVMFIDPSGYKAQSYSELSAALDKAQRSLEKAKQLYEYAKKRTNYYYNPSFAFIDRIGGYSKLYKLQAEAGQNEQKALFDLRVAEKMVSETRKALAQLALFQNDQRNRLNAKKEVDSMIVQYPSSSTQYFDVKTCVSGVDSAKRYSLLKLLLSNLPTVKHDYLRGLLTNEAEASLMNYEEFALTREQALERYYLEQEQRNDLVIGLGKLILGANNPKAFTSALIDMVRNAALSQEVDQGIDIIIETLKSLNAGYKVTKFITGEFVENGAGELMNALDRLHNDVDRIKGATYATIRFKISPISINSALPIRMISARVILDENGNYYYDSDNPLNYILPSDI